MSEIMTVGRSADRLDIAPQHSPYNRLQIWLDDKRQITLGVHGATTLVAELPFGNHDIALKIFRRIRGFAYQPFDMSGAMLDPAAELGDGIFVGDTYSGIYQMDVCMGPLYRAEISAPDEETINHEIRLTSKSERHFRREMDSVRAEISLVDGAISLETDARAADGRELRGLIALTTEKITAEVTNRESDVSDLRSSISLTDRAIRAETSARMSEIESLRSEFAVTPEGISAKVDKSGGSYSSFGWNLTPTYWELRSNGATVLKVDKSGAEIRGKVTAESGSIGGFDIKSRCLSTNGATWNSENNYGVYIGPEGIKLGSKFKVDNAGNIVAGSASIEGTVSAKNILIEGEHGYMDGKGILAESIFGEPGREIAPGGIQTFATNGWINSSLGNGNWAADVVGGFTKFDYMTGKEIYGNVVYADDLIMVQQAGMEIALYPGSIDFVGRDGDIWRADVMLWNRVHR